MASKSEQYRMAGLGVFLFECYTGARTICKDLIVCFTVNPRDSLFGFA